VGSVLLSWEACGVKSGTKARQSIDVLKRKRSDEVVLNEAAAGHRLRRRPPFVMRIPRVKGWATAHEAGVR